MKVTILLSVYNGEKMLRRALDSISAQTYKNIELYLVDHGSGDSTLKIIEEFKCNFPCYKRHYDRIPEDKKYNASRVGKIILSEVESDLFYWFSHDDIMHKDFILNNIIQYLNCPNMKIWQSAIWWFDANVGINMRKEKPYMYSYNNMESLKRKMIERSIVNCPSVFFSTEMIKEIGVSEPEYMNCGDYEMFLRIIDNGECLPAGAKRRRG